ncbi:PulJ/GspJ family protein [Rheinheimera maricola]|uniref:Prepilin-type N-terminal cleavage/methylation domain-containing protein n=1 Tax=Rheinheimera maricola TaxID=2793282 RepID=A0ABS7X407_9GAMM|nr:prepilin-type N-terminal cleavage/methylation domain-containing protein [Rheinheimera maricola]MBZ9610285.1 prepilin-type N-terminal cleavage/methylation domain-containing protein [Rheinheimera maricola]
MTKQSGLTLIEVLIASLILFMVLGVAASFFQQQVLVQRQSQRYVQLAAQQNNILNRIQFSFREGVNEGEIIVGNSKYNWKATAVVKRSQYGGAGEGFSTQSSRIVTLYNIEVQGETASANYQFRLVRWNDKAV